MVWAASAYAILTSAVVFQIAGLSTLSIHVALEETRRARGAAILVATGLLLSGFLGTLLGAKVADGDVELVGFALMTCSIAPAILYARKTRPQR
jgi:hypothetical protein